jgi:hypothetical protein
MMYCLASFSAFVLPYLVPKFVMQTAAVDPAVNDNAPV